MLNLGRPFIACEAVSKMATRAAVEVRAIPIEDRIEVVVRQKGRTFPRPACTIIEPLMSELPARNHRRA